MADCLFFPQNCNIFYTICNIRLFINIFAPVKSVKSDLKEDMMKHFLLQMTLICFFMLREAQTDINAGYFFSHVSSRSGLSQVNVKSIIQDSYGFMWFGTRNLLNRYDGTNMKVFNCYDPVSGQGNNNISALYEDKNKHLWVGTSREKPFKKMLDSGDNNKPRIIYRNYIEMGLDCVVCIGGNGTQKTANKLNDENQVFTVIIRNSILFFNALISTGKIP
jgi:hypothetical protein